MRAARRRRNAHEAVHAFAAIRRSRSSCSWAFSSSLRSSPTGSRPTTRTRAIFATGCSPPPSGAEAGTSCSAPNRLGRCVLSRIMHGARYALAISAVGIFVGAAIGTRARAGGRATLGAGPTSWSCGSSTSRSPCRAFSLRLPSRRRGVRASRPSSSSSHSSFGRTSPGRYGPRS